MSVSGINNTNETMNIFLNPMAQAQQQSSIYSGNGGGDTVTFSAEAMEMYNAAKAEKQLSDPKLSDVNDENADSNSLLGSESGEETLTNQAMSGAKKGGGGGGGGGSSDDDEDEDESWYDEWFETMYGIADETEGSAEDGFVSSLLEDDKQI